MLSVAMRAALAAEPTGAERRGISMVSPAPDHPTIDVAGDVVLPGACMRAFDAKPGDDFVAEFDGLGSVHLSFA